MLSENIAPVIQSPIAPRAKPAPERAETTGPFALRRRTIGDNALGAPYYSTGDTQARRSVSSARMPWSEFRKSQSSAQA
jgi:hypothetical protein